MLFCENQHEQIGFMITFSKPNQIEHVNFLIHIFLLVRCIPLVYKFFVLIF